MEWSAVSSQVSTGRVLVSGLVPCLAQSGLCFHSSHNGTWLGRAPPRISVFASLLIGVFVLVLPTQWFKEKKSSSETEREPSAPIELYRIDRINPSAEDYVRSTKTPNQQTDLTASGAILLLAFRWAARNNYILSSVRFQLSPSGVNTSSSNTEIHKVIPSKPLFSTTDLKRDSEPINTRELYAHGWNTFVGKKLSIRIPNIVPKAPRLLMDVEPMNQFSMFFNKLLK